MDGLSAAASVTGVLSITIQLAGGIKKLYDFFSEVNDAPQEIQETVQELRLLGSFLERLREHEKRQPLDPIAIAVLESCNNKVTGLLKFIAQWEPAYTSRKHRVRTWNSFKATLQRDRLDKLKLSLEETKSSLILIRQDLSERLQYTFKDEVLSAISHGFAKLEFQRTTKTTTTEAEGASIPQNHVSDLRSEIRQLTRTMSVPWIRSGLQSEAEGAMRELENSLRHQDLPGPRNTSRTDSKDLARGLSNETGSIEESLNARNDDVDLEKGADSNAPRPRILPRKSSHRNLVNSVMTIKNTFFGVIYIHTNQFVIENTQRSFLASERPPSREFRTSFKFHPANWLMSWNLNLGAQLSVTHGSRGWKTDICTFRACADNHQIFEFCRAGNITGVRASLSTGAASPWDTNTHGWTPLHIAAHECNIELCKLLLDSGANQDALTSDFVHGNYEVCSPLVAACTYQRGKHIPDHQRIDVLRLLLQEADLDFTASDSQAWKMILVLLERSRPSSGFTQTDEPATWLLEILQEELRRHFQPANAFWLLLFCCESRCLMETLVRICPDVVHAISDDPDGFTLFHTKIAEGFPEEVIPSFLIAARHGSDLHRAGSTRSYGAPAAPAPPGRDTPTSLAMRRSWTFILWREVLIKLDCDIAAFVAAELEYPHQPLAERGWSFETLTALLGDGIATVPYKLPPTLCWQCQREVHRVYDLEEEWWEEFLAEVRSGGSLQRSRSSSSSSWRTGSSDAPFYDAVETHSPTSPVNKSDTKVPSPPIFLCWKCSLMRSIRNEGGVEDDQTGDVKKYVP